MHRLTRLYNFIGIRSDRTKNIFKHIGFSSIYKIGTIIANFMLVPLSISYLDTDTYGVWLTLSTFILWFSFFDIGFGNGLRNKFTETNSKGELKLAKSYVSTAYFSITLISLLLILLFLIVNPFINWAKVFNSQIGLNDELSLVVPIVFVSFAIQLVLRLIVSLNQAAQNHSINEKIQFYTQLISLIFVFILLEIGDGSITTFGLLFSIVPLIILLFLNVKGFKYEFKVYKPTFSSFNRQNLKSITGLGFSFFVTKIGALLLLTTDTFIISQLYGPVEVVNYNIVYKYFSIVSIGFSVLVNPFWSSFTEAYINNDFNWIKKSVNNVQKLWILIPIVLVIMLVVSNWFYKIWVGSEIIISFNMSLMVAIFSLLFTFNQIYNQFINGVGKIRINLIISIFIILFNIPLSLFFSIILELGASGVVLGSCLCLLIKCIFLPIQYFKIINNNARGLWFK